MRMDSAALYRTSASSVSLIGDQPLISTVHCRVMYLISRSHASPHSASSRPDEYFHRSVVCGYSRDLSRPATIVFEVALAGLSRIAATIVGNDAIKILLNHRQRSANQVAVPIR